MADRRTASAAVTFREKEFVLGMLRQSTTVGNPRGEMGVKDVNLLSAAATEDRSLLADGRQECLR